MLANVAISKTFEIALYKQKVLILRNYKHYFEVIEIPDRLDYRNYQNKIFQILIRKFFRH